MWISELRYQDATTQTYLGSPSLVRMPDGGILATHDYFGTGCPKNHYGREHLTSVYRSDDDGLTWDNLTHITGAFWSGLFVHGDAVYLLGTSYQFGSIVIRRSEDGGNTWTDPGDSSSGLLFEGGPDKEPPNYHCAPVPVLVSQGRLWRAFEDCSPQKWGSGFKAMVISADLGADLLDATQWNATNKLAYDQDTDPADYGENPSGGSGWLEGNVVEAPDGGLWDFLRVHSFPILNKAAMVQIDTDSHTLSFDPESGFVNMPGGGTKFTIRRHPETRIYWSLVNDMEDDPKPLKRNRLTLVSSPDLKEWTTRKHLLWDNLEMDPQLSFDNTGFQYVDWQFDGDGIIYLVRTAYDGAHNFHDSNRITFSRINDLSQV